MSNSKELSVVSSTKPFHGRESGVNFKLETGLRSGSPFASPQKSIKGGLEVIEIEKPGISILLKSGKATPSATGRDFLVAVISPTVAQGSSEEEGWLVAISTKELEQGVTVTNGCLESWELNLKRAKLKFPCTTHIYLGWYHLARVSGPKHFFGNAALTKYLIHAWSFTGTYTIGASPSQLSLTMNCFPFSMGGVWGESPLKPVELTIKVGKSGGAQLSPRVDSSFHPLQALWTCCCVNSCCQRAGDEVAKGGKPVGTRFVLKPLVQHVPSGLTDEILRISEGDILEARVFFFPFRRYQNIELELSLIQSLVCDSNVDMIRRHIDTVVKRHTVQFNVGDGHRVEIDNDVAVALHKLTFEIPQVSGFVMYMDKMKIKSYKHDLQMRCTQKGGNGATGDILLAMCTFPLVIHSEGVKFGSSEQEQEEQGDKNENSTVDKDDGQ